MADTRDDGQANARLLIGVVVISAALLALVIWSAHLTLRELEIAPPPPAPLPAPPDKAATLGGAVALAGVGGLLAFFAWRSFTTWRTFRHYTPASAIIGQRRSNIAAIGRRTTLLGAMSASFLLAGAWFAWLAMRLPRAWEPPPSGPWSDCNPGIPGLVILFGVIGGAAGLDMWSSSGRRNGFPWQEMMFAIGCVIAAYLLYLGSCLYPEGTS
jgi:hypothetical protein